MAVPTLLVSGVVGSGGEVVMETTTDPLELVFYGFSEGPATAGPCVLGACLDLAVPVLGGMGAANAQGAGTATVTLPYGIEAGQEVTFQVMSLGQGGVEVSAPVTVVAVDTCDIVVGLLPGTAYELPRDVVNLAEAEGCTLRPVYLPWRVSEAMLEARQVDVVWAPGTHGQGYSVDAEAVADYARANGAGMVAYGVLKNGFTAALDGTPMLELAGVVATEVSGRWWNCNRAVTVLEPTHPIAAGLPANVTIAGANTSCQEPVPGLWDPWAMMPGAVMVTESNDHRQVLIANDDGVTRGAWMTGYWEPDNGGSATRLMVNAIRWAAHED